LDRIRHDAASDAPWHDPALVAAMLALPFGTSDLATQPAVTVAS
jgi:hypothetical protein